MKMTVIGVIVGILVALVGMEVSAKEPPVAKLVQIEGEVNTVVTAHAGALSGARSISSPATRSEPVKMVGAS